MNSAGTDAASSTRERRKKAEHEHRDAEHDRCRIMSARFSGRDNDRVGRAGQAGGAAAEKGYCYAHEPARIGDDIDRRRVAALPQHGEALGIMDAHDRDGQRQDQGDHRRPGEGRRNEDGMREGKDERCRGRARPFEQPRGQPGG